MPRLRSWGPSFWIVSLLVIPRITCVAQAPNVEPVTDQETELGQAMYAKLKENVEIIESSPLYDSLKPVGEAISRVAQPHTRKLLLNRSGRNRTTYLTKGQ